MGKVAPASFEPYPYSCKRVDDLGRYAVEYGSLATPSGPSPYTILRMGRFAAALAVVPGEVPRIVLAKQYRYAVDSWQIELPAGGMEVGETPEQAAVRELREEVGLVPEEVVDLGMVYTSGGSTTEEAHLVAVRCAPGSVPTQFDPGEQVERMLVTREEFEAMMLDDTFGQAAGYVAWYRFCARGIDRMWL